MVVRIDNIEKWKALPPGDVLEFQGEGLGRRKIRLDVNCVVPTRFDVVTETGASFFLAVVQGLEVLQFAADGDCYLAATTGDPERVDAEVWYYTAEDDQHGVEPSIGAVSFAKLAHRRTRNPELERMMFKLEQNAKRRLDAVTAQLEAMEARSIAVGTATSASAVPGDQVTAVGDAAAVPAAEGVAGDEPA